MTYVIFTFIGVKLLYKRIFLHLMLIILFLGHGLYAAGFVLGDITDAQESQLVKITAETVEVEPVAQSMSMACLIAPPQKPSNIKISSSEFSDKIVISNYGVACAQSYNIYRAQSNSDPLEFFFLENTTSTHYADFVDANTVWLYKVTAVSIKGESYVSNIVKGVTATAQEVVSKVLSAPSEVVLVDDTNITLSWKAQEELTYMVYRDTTGLTNAEFEPLTQWPGTQQSSIVDINVTAEVNYHYYVVAVNNALEGERTYVSRFMPPQLAEQTYSILGTFGSYEFAGGDTAFNWVFTTSNGSSFQLRGEEPSAADVFGWRIVEDISVPAPQWYMLKIGGLPFDWILASTNLQNQQVYKLKGVSEAGGFEYSEKLDVNYTLEGNELHFSAP